MAGHTRWRLGERVEHRSTRSVRAGHGMPGDQPQPYAVYVDDQDMVWLNDFGANALVRYDPAQDVFETVVLPSAPARCGVPSPAWTS